MHGSKSEWQILLYQWRITRLRNLSLCVRILTLVTEVLDIYTANFLESRTSYQNTSSHGLQDGEQIILRYALFYMALLTTGKTTSADALWLYITYCSHLLPMLLYPLFFQETYSPGKRQRHPWTSHLWGICSWHRWMSAVPKENKLEKQKSGWQLLLNNLFDSLPSSNLGILASSFHFL